MKAYLDCIPPGLAIIKQKEKLTRKRQLAERTCKDNGSSPRIASASRLNRVEWIANDSFKIVICYRSGEFCRELLHKIPPGDC